MEQVHLFNQWKGQQLIEVNQLQLFLRESSLGTNPLQIRQMSHEQDNLLIWCLYYR